MPLSGSRGVPVAPVAAPLALLTLLLIPVPTWAQDIQPGDQREELPDFPYEEGEEERRRVLPRVPTFEPEPAEPGDALPQLQLPGTPDSSGLQAGRRVFVREVRVVGSTALPEAAIRDIASGYVGRELSLADIQQLRDDVTRAYVSEGFVTSGAVIPPQSIDDGVLELQVVEGRLARIDVATDGRFHERYLRRRLARSAGTPVNVLSLRERLQILQQDERIRSVRAQLLPTEERGETALRVEVEENTPLILRLAGNNYTTPSLGEGRAEAGLGYRNVTGFGDEILGEYRWSPGLHDVRGHYDVPFTVWDTRLVLAGRGTWSEIVEDPFDELDIESETESYAVSLHQPLLRSLRSRAGVFLTGEYRRSESFLLGDPFSFSLGPEEGESKLALIRGGAQWTFRSARFVVAVRAQLTWGIDALDATSHSDDDVPDGQFVAGLGQLQWAARLPWLGVQLLGRADGQIADDPLLGIEQFSIGGRHTVRGYRENQLVRDNGAVGSVELRIPLPWPSIAGWRPALWLAPFYDIGYASNQGRGAFPRGEDQTLESAGVGAIVEILPGLELEIYWGEALRNVPKGGEYSLQDDGIHMQLEWGYRGWPWGDRR